MPNSAGWYISDFVFQHGRKKNEFTQKKCWKVSFWKTTCYLKEKGLRKEKKKKNTNKMVGNWFPRLDMKTRRFVYQISVLSIKTVIKSFLKKYFEKTQLLFQGRLSWNLSFAHESSWKPRCGQQLFSIEVPCRLPFWTCHTSYKNYIYLG